MLRMISLFWLAPLRVASRSIHALSSRGKRTSREAFSLSGGARFDRREVTLIRNSSNAPCAGSARPAQPSPTIGQCLNGGLSWLEVECKPRKTRASPPLDAFPPPRDTADLETRSGAQIPITPERPLPAAPA